MNLHFFKNNLCNIFIGLLSLEFVNSFKCSWKEKIKQLCKDKIFKYDWFYYLKSNLSAISYLFLYLKLNAKIEFKLFSNEIFWI